MNNACSDLEEKEWMKLYLSMLPLISNTIEQTSNLLLLLLDKRITLAEKAIQEEIASYIEHNSFFLTQLSAAIRQHKFLLGKDVCLTLEQINTELRNDLLAFIKAANYDLNYLEQYFEHEFWVELINKDYTKKFTALRNNLEAIY